MENISIPIKLTLTFYYRRDGFRSPYAELIHPRYNVYLLLSVFLRSGMAEKTGSMEAEIDNDANGELKNYINFFDKCNKITFSRYERKRLLKIKRTLNIIFLIQGVSSNTRWTITEPLLDIRF